MERAKPQAGTDRTNLKGGYRRRPGVAGLAAFALLSAMRPAGGQDNAGATFAKWHTFCDKALVCAAYTYSGSEGNPQSGHVFTLERARDGDGWTMAIALDGVEPRLDLGLQASVIRYGHDGDPIPHFETESLILRGGRASLGTAGAYTLYLTGPSAGTVMERLRPGDILDFEFGGCRDEFLNAGFLLDGVTAALAWIDERQGRAGGSNAVSDTVPQRGRHVTSNCGQ